MRMDQDILERIANDPRLNSNGNGKQQKTESENGLEEKRQFWYWVTDGKSSKLRFGYQNARLFLQSRGFYRYKIHTVSRFIQAAGKVVKQVEPEDIRNFVADFAEKGNYEKGQVLEMILRAGHQYFGESQLSFMYPFEGDFMQPERGVQRLFFKNKYWEISKDGVLEKDLAELPKYIWESQKIDFEPELSQKPLVKVFHKNGKFYVGSSELFDRCHIARFLINTSCFDWEQNFELQDVGGGRKQYALKTPFASSEETTAHFAAKMLALGYLIYSYRDRSETKAIVCMDGVESEVGASCGGTGKSIFGQIAGYVAPVVTIDGKKRNLTEDKFIYQEVDERTQILFFDDCRTNLDFEHFFSQIANKIDIEGKGIPKYSLPSPKFLFTTNHAVNGEGNSFERRQYLLAFSNWYNQYRTPKDDFGCVLFDDWDQEQWNLFYNFLACCVQTYLKFGFGAKIDNGDLVKRKLRQQMGEAFLEWAELFYAPDSGNLHLEKEKQELYEHFGSSYPKEVKYTGIRKFKKKLKKYCEYKEYLFNPKQNGGDDKRSGKEFVTVAEK